MAYPNTNLPNDQMDPPFGGQNPLKFGGQAWAFINSVLQFLEAAHLLYNRRPWRSIVLKTTYAATAGQACVVDAASKSPDNTPLTGPWPSASFNEPRLAGIYYAGASAGANAVVIESGLVPLGLHQMGQPGTPQDVGINPATGQLRVAVVGDVLIGRLLVSGDVLITAPKGVALA